jgi:hypothetical protein
LDGYVLPKKQCIHLHSVVLEFVAAVLPVIILHLRVVMHVIIFALLYMEGPYSGDSFLDNLNGQSMVLLSCFPYWRLSQVADKAANILDKDIEVRLDSFQVHK